MTVYVSKEVAKRLDVLLSELVRYMSPEVCDGQVMSMAAEARSLSREMISPRSGGLLLSTHTAHYGHCYPVANPETDQGLS